MPGIDQEPKCLSKVSVGFACGGASKIRAKRHKQKLCLLLVFLLLHLELESRPPSCFANDLGFTYQSTPFSFLVTVLSTKMTRPPLSLSNTYPHVYIQTHGERAGGLLPPPLLFYTHTHTRTPPQLVRQRATTNCLLLLHPLLRCFTCITLVKKLHSPVPHP